MEVRVWALIVLCICFNETRGQFLKSNRKWLLGPHTVKEEESYKYLGTMFSKYVSLKINIKDASDKLRGRPSV